MLKIISIGNSGNLQDEHVYLKAEADCNLGDYLFTDSTYGSNEAPSNKLRHVFFFPVLTVKKGDYVALWTQKGTYSVNAATTTKAPQHNLYWGLQETVWNITGDKAFLFAAPRVQRSALAVGPKKR